MAITAVRLRDKITVEQPAESQNTTGDTIQVWNELVADVPAEVFQVGGKEYKFGDQIRADISHIVTVRIGSVTKTITAKMRLKNEENILNIEVVKLTGLKGHRKKWVQLMCKEVKV